DDRGRGRGSHGRGANRDAGRAALSEAARFRPCASDYGRRTRVPLLECATSLGAIVHAERSGGKSSRKDGDDRLGASGGQGRGDGGLAERFVRLWPLADIPFASRNVRFGG